MKVCQNISAIILSAGMSGRMGRFKPLLPFGDTTALGRVVNLYRAAGIDDICVVVGHKSDEVKAALKSSGARWVENPNYRQGMFSSILAGIRALPGDAQGFLVHPVDIPLVRSCTVAALVKHFRENSSAVWHPSFDGQSGHPPLVPARLAPEILKWSGRDGLRSFWAAGRALMKTLPVADEAILLDLDTQKAYRRMLVRLESEDLPTAEECRVLMTQVADVPEPVWRHCRAVATVAVAMTEAVIGAGGSLDVDLIRSAALVHDIAKTGKQHAAAGAKLLGNLGYPKLAGIVKVHMDIETTTEESLDEAQIVFLADKLLEGDRLCSLDDRMARKLAKYGGDDTAREVIRRRFQMAHWIQAKVEHLTGRRVSEWCRGRLPEKGLQGVTPSAAKLVKR